jgi:hypothetical protein
MNKEPSPVMINPQKPIKDPSNSFNFKPKIVTKRRLRKCFNGFCLSESYGDNKKEWSRRKFGDK